MTEADVSILFMQEKYGKNWDCRPHGSDPNSGDKCECETCCEWIEDYKRWEEEVNDGE